MVSTRPERTSAQRLRRRLSWAFALGGAALLTSGCTVDEALRMGMPQPATKEGPIIENLWIGSWIAAWAVGALVWGLIIAAIILFRRRSHHEGMPKQTKYNVPIEFLYTVAPLVMILVLASFVWRDQTELMSLTDKSTHTVGVDAFRWSWAFNYKEEGVYDVGTPEAKPTLWLPVDERTRFQLTSPDVDHSFWIPDFLFKMDVIPGRMNQFELTPDKLGTFPGRCAELCGVDHSAMLFDVKVVSRAEYEAHIQELKDMGQTGVFDTGRASTKEGVTA